MDYVKNQGATRKKYTNKMNIKLNFTYAPQFSANGSTNKLVIANETASSLSKHFPNRNHASEM